MRFPDVSQPWTANLDWESQPGQTLRSLALTLETDVAWKVDVFGSAPLEMAFGPQFVSADVDMIFPLHNYLEAEAILSRAGFARGKRAHYVQACPPAAFRTSPKWKDRVLQTRTPDEGAAHVLFRLAHPIDVVIGKLNRLDEKDWRAIQLLRELTGGPEEAVLLRELRDAPDLFSLAFMPTSANSFRENVERLWRDLFGREIELNSEILIPARQQLDQSYDLQ